MRFIVVAVQFVHEGEVVFGHRSVVYDEPATGREDPPDFLQNLVDVGEVVGGPTAGVTR